MARDEMVKKEEMTETMATTDIASASVPPSSGAGAAAVLPGGAAPGAAGTAGTAGSGSNGSNSSSHQPSQSTVFIHKLYNILGDNDLRDLIWWSPSGLSFLIRPTERFSRALATYFKHTNIASFVRQLNMYGFHKVSNDHGRSSTEHENSGASADGQEDIKIWKFRHSTGLFKRGDVEGLKYIKRRSSRNMASSNSRKNSHPSGHNNGSVNGINISNNNNNNNNTNNNNNNNNSNCNSNNQAQEDEHEQIWHHHQQQRVMLPEPEQSFFPSQAPQVHQPLAFTSYPQPVPPGVPATSATPVDPFVEAKYVEILKSYNNLKNEYSFLQYRHEEVLEHLRGLNLDMVHLLELLEVLVTLQNGAEQSPQELAGFEQELLRFKTLLAGRVHRNSDVQVQQQLLQRHNRDSMPHSGLSVPTCNSSVPSLVQQHVFAVPARPASAMNIVDNAHGPPLPPPPPPQVVDHSAGRRMMMMNPFETTGNGFKRNMSILMDPLAPAPSGMLVAASPSHSQPYANPPQASAGGCRMQQKPCPESSSRISMVATKNTHSGVSGDFSNFGLSQQHLGGPMRAASICQGVCVGPGESSIKEEHPAPMLVPTRPLSAARDQGEILRPIPTRFAGLGDRSRGGSAVYSLLNEERPTTPPLEDRMTPTKRVKL